MAKAGEVMSKTSAEVKNRWNAKHYDRILLLVPKGYREEIRERATAEGKTVNQFIREAIAAKMD